MKGFIKSFLEMFNYRLSKIDSNYVNYPIEQTNEGILNDFLEKQSVSLVLDIGANVGQWANEIRESGYGKKIISVEPLTSAFSVLSSNCSEDTFWTCQNFAVGNCDTTSEINISKNSVSSSLLPMLDSHIEAAPESLFYQKEKIQILKLDSIAKQSVNINDIVFLKIDTQGYEKIVLDGAKDLLKQTVGIQLEMSFDPLYRGEINFTKLKIFLESLGFILFHIQNGFRHSKSQELMQVDTIFMRK
ncbi:FkbM family methyltransferase [Opitutales bacterium]|nr:FkbM family methyltransferase [Opitutales bacterium]